MDSIDQLYYRALLNCAAGELERVPLYGPWGVVRGTKNDSEGDVGGDGAGPGGHCDMCSVEIIISTKVLGI